MYGGVCCVDGLVVGVGGVEYVDVDVVFGDVDFGCFFYEWDDFDCGE